MTPSPRRAGRRLDEALAQALEDLERGLTPLQILDRYPEYEEELAPLLETAYGLRTTRWPTLSMAARVSGRERMHAALAEHKARRGSVVAPFWRQLGAGLALVLLAGMTYVASPVSPFRGISRPRAIATVEVTPTPTWTATWTVRPSPTNTTLPSATPTATEMIRRTPEPTDEANRLKDLWRETAAAPTATGTPVPGGPIPTRTPTPTLAAPAGREPEQIDDEPPPTAQPATLKPSARKPAQIAEPTKAPAAAVSSSAVKEKQKPKPAGVKANGAEPAHEQRDAVKESRKVDPPPVNSRKP